MNDFFLATNRSMTEMLLGEAVEVRQIQMKDFDQWVIHAEPIKQALIGKNDSDEILSEMVQSNVLHCVMLCATVTSLKHDMLFAMAQVEMLEFIKLVKLVLAVNQAYFIEEKKRPGRTKKAQEDKTATWFDSFQYLISMGHSHSDIMQMTYGAFERYLKAAQKSERQKLAAISNAVRSAQHASAKEFKRYFKELTT